MKKKKEETQEIDFVRQANEYYESYLKSRVQSYKTERVVIEDEYDYIEAVVECDGYNAHFRINVDYWFHNCVELYFSYPNCDIKFDDNHIFNTLEINDFNEYIFDFGEDCEHVERAFNEAFDFLNKYDYDIRKAGESANLAYMIQLYNEDDEYYRNVNLRNVVTKVLRLNNIKSRMFKTKKEKDKNAFLKYADKVSAEIGLDNSTKRLVNYLKQGYDVPDVKSDSNDLSFDKKNLLSYIICDTVGLVICAIIVLFIKSATLEGDVLSTIIDIGVPGLLLGYLLTRLFATRLMMLLMPNEEKEAIIEYRKKRFDDLNIFDKVFAKYLAPVLATAIFIFLIFIY